MHQIDPARLDLAREFKASPLGPHSPDLQKLLKILRWDPIEGSVVAVQLEPGGLWHLARLTGPKGHPIELFREQTYATDIKFVIDDQHSNHCAALLRPRTFAAAE